MKLDPEERIVAAALDQAALNQANDRGAGARTGFSRDGHAGLPDNRGGLMRAGSITDQPPIIPHPAPSTRKPVRHLLSHDRRPSFARPGNRGFVSGFLQRRVCELSVPRCGKSTRARVRA